MITCTKYKEYITMKKMDEKTNNLCNNIFNCKFNVHRGSYKF